MFGSSLSMWMSPWLREQGDIAANAIQMDRAAEGRELLGPYSQHGFHHPGPSLYYVHAATDRWVGFLPTPMARRLAIQLSLNLAALAGAAWLLRRAGLSGPTAILGFFLLVAPTVFLGGGNMALLASTWGPSCRIQARHSASPPAARGPGTPPGDHPASSRWQR
jgi:hypothetical protein